MPGGLHVFPEQKCLQIYLLGSPRVNQAEFALSIPRRNVRGLLYYLAAQTRPVPRDQLYLLFWPDISEDYARRNLTRLLTHLRRALPYPEILIATNDQVSLDQSLFWCDALEFHLLTHQERQIPDLQYCAGLYCGTFLSGFSIPDCPEYEQWLTHEQIALENVYLQVLSNLIEFKTDEHEYAEAIEFAQRYLDIDSLAEEIHRRLITLYALVGDRTRALRQYETCIAVLENELGARPLPETQAVYKAVLDGVLKEFHQEMERGFQPAGIDLLRLDIPMVGRSQILASLEKNFSQVRTGYSQLALISGEPGIGKTRLLHSLITRCQNQALVLFCSSDRGETSLPYHPIVEALRSSPTLCPPSLATVWRSEISRLLPEITSLDPGLPPPVSLRGDEARIRLFEALCQFILCLQADFGPVLVCLDNLHWFDQTSLNWLIYFCRHHLMKSRKIMLVGTYRSEDNQNLAELLGSLSRLGYWREIHLEGLDQGDIIELLGHVLTPAPGIESFASNLREASGGNPFFILETLRTLEEENRLSGYLDQLVDLPLSDSVREVVDRRLGRLNASTRQVLEAGAILAPQFGFKTVRTTSGRSEMETATGLDELVNRHLLVKRGDAYSFSHDLARRAAVASISPMRLKLLHQRAGRVRERNEPEAVGVIAHHFDVGGDWKKAFHYYHQSAQEAEALFAWQEVVSRYERMLEILDHLDPGNDSPETLDQRSKLFAKIILLLHNQGDLAGRNERLQQMGALVAASDNQSLELNYLLLRSRYLHLDGRYLEAVEATERGLSLAEDLNDTGARCRLLAQNGFINFFLGRADVALTNLEAARGLTDRSKDLELRANVLGRLAFVKCLFGKYFEALEHHKEARTCYQQLGNHYFAAQHLTEIGDICASLGLYEESRGALAEILDLARKTHLRYDEGHTLLAMGWLHACQGEYEMAVSTLSEALEILDPLQIHQLTVTIITSMSLVHYHLGNYKASQAYARQGLMGSRKIKFRARAAEALILLARIEAAKGRLSFARICLDEGLLNARAVHNVELVATGLIVAAGIERCQGNLSEALSLVEQALSFAVQIDPMNFEMWAQTEAGLILAAQNRAAAAQERTSRAVSLVPQANQSWIRSEQVHLTHARVLRLNGDLDMAYEQECLAMEMHRLKAAGISDPILRKQFQAAFEKEFSNIVYPNL